MQLILASQSPRRRELMGLFGLPFAVCVACIDETMAAGEAPDREVARVSRAKAEAICRTPEDVVIAADTVVVLEGTILGKPRDAEEAIAMLTALSGKSHQVMTGLTVLRGQKALVHTEVTDVRFRPISPKEIEAYVATGEPMDKAGSYGIQGRGGLFVERIQGDYYNVMGLPVCRLYQMLKEIIPEIMEDIQ